MSKFTNPITQKLAKNHKNTESSKLITEESDTPVKTANRTRKEQRSNKENTNIMPFDTQMHLNNSNSLRKISLLQKKNSRKDFSTNFYQRELLRRKQKYENQLIQIQQKFQNQLYGIQRKLITQMKKQQELDSSIEILRGLKYLLQNEKSENIKESLIMEYLHDLDLESLLQCNDVFQHLTKQTEQNSFGEFTYTLETITQNMKNSNRQSQELLLDETLEYYFTGK